METEIFIFHETQDSLLCGQHCLNNLLQQPIFNFIDLSNIAIELSELEKNLLNENNHSKSLKNDDTGYVDNTGNFSFDVLNHALRSVCEVELLSWTGSEGRNHLDPNLEVGFIINQNNHWYTIRKVVDHWWNLDSLLEKPSHISPFYLNALLSQLRDDGCSIFLVRGNLSEAGTNKYTANDDPQGVWWEQSRLLGNSSQEFSANYPLKSHNDNDLDDDTMLAIALSESLN